LMGNTSSSLCPCLSESLPTDANALNDIAWCAACDDAGSCADSAESDGACVEESPPDNFRKAAEELKTLLERGVQAPSPPAKPSFSPAAEKVQEPVRVGVHPKPSFSPAVEKVQEPATVGVRKNAEALKPTLLPRSVPTPSSPPTPAFSVAADKVVMRVIPGEQESDMLERLTKGPNRCDEMQNRVRLVSLGCYCGPKLSFQKMGRGAETLPFDWIRTKMEGLLHFLRSDFQGFFDGAPRRLPVPGSSGMVAFRGPLHSFWHDDPTEASMRERYARRINRFQAIDARSGRLVLFVRVAGNTGELRRAPELVDELVARFGDGARLLLVLNFQHRFMGPALVRGHDRLMVHCLSSAAHHRESETFGAPYVEAVRIALDWVLGRSFVAYTASNLEALEGEVTVDDWGKAGLGGLRAFEDDQLELTP